MNGWSPQRNEHKSVCVCVCVSKGSLMGKAKRSKSIPVCRSLDEKEWETDSAHLSVPMEA